ncbi:MAG: PadR family transcriptional regulator, partial [Armatimonadota bacterium]|nr:PadR family transcriptional regulator [Armatimonadota bacterium]
MHTHTHHHDTERREHHGHHSHEHPDRGHHHHPEGGGHGRGGEGGRHGGGPRGRARRGEARYVLLDALRDGPKHGYEIIKTLEEKSGGEYVPSPGTVYPTMQYLEDLEQVRSDQNTERRVYHLTEAGQAELNARAEDLAAFWARFAAPSASTAEVPEVRFLQEELDALTRTVWGGLRSLGAGDAAEIIRRVRQAVEGCRN